jgi:hypothetical protein
MSVLSDFVDSQKLKFKSSTLIVDDSGFSGIIAHLDSSCDSVFMSSGRCSEHCCYVFKFKETEMHFCQKCYHYWKNQKCKHFEDKQSKIKFIMSA